MMGGNVRIDDAALQARAREIQKQMSDLGVDYTSNPITDKTTGAIFTYTKTAEGKITCSYKYHDEKVKPVLLFERATVATSNARLATLTPEQLEEYKENHPNSYLTTEYTAAEAAIKQKEQLEANLNSYDKETRKNAEKGYKELVEREIFISGTADEKAARRMAKYAMKDARAGERAELTTTFYDKEAYEYAKARLKVEQNAAKRRIERAKKYGYAPNPADLEIMERRVEYIKDKDVRRYVAGKPQRFKVNGEFSSGMYKDWARTHLQGDNTLTTGERNAASSATGLSGGDMKKAVRYAGFDAQNDPTLIINMAKSAVGIIAPLVVAALANKNIHDFSKLSDRIELKADPVDPGKILIFVDGKSVAESTSEVVANFKDVAVRNALLGAVSSLLCNYVVNPEAKRDKVSDGITASTITTQNIFRGKEVVDIDGNITIDIPEEVTEEYAAEIIEFLDKQEDCTVTFNIEAQATGRTRKVNGKSLPEFKAHLWEAMYAAYQIPQAEQKAFRQAYRAQYLNGAAYYDNKDQTTKCEFEYQYNGEPRKVKFNKDAFDSTWTYYTQKRGVRSTSVNERGDSNEVQRYRGSASFDVGTGRQEISTGNQSFSSDKDARNYLSDKIMRRPDLTTDQKMQAIQRIETAPVTKEEN